MRYKFKVGDRVKYNSGSWEGSTGTITAVRQHAQYHVVFDKGTTAYAYKSTAHNTDEFELELIPMQDKVLIKPEDYHTLKKDDEVEITVKSTLNYDQLNNPTLVSLGSHVIAVKCIHELYKLTPKATKLEVGEIVIDTPLACEIIAISKINKQISVRYKDSDTLNTFAKSTFDKSYRKSGIPIDWEATFS